MATCQAPQVLFQTTVKDPDDSKLTTQKVKINASTGLPVCLEGISPTVFFDLYLEAIPFQHPRK
jgi:hypothetical protein